jgi:hypothetical protein
VTVDWYAATRGGAAAPCGAAADATAAVVLGKTRTGCMTATTPSAAGAGANTWTRATRTVRCGGLDAGTVVAGAAAAEATAAVATTVVADGANANHIDGRQHGPTNPPATTSAAFMGRGKQGP